MKKRKYILIICYCILLMVICTFVPWKAKYRNIEVPLGYSFIWAPPKYSYKISFYQFSKVDIERIILELIGATSLGILLFTLLKVVPYKDEKTKIFIKKIPLSEDPHHVTLKRPLEIYKEDLFLLPEEVWDSCIKYNQNKNLHLIGSKYGLHFQLYATPKDFTIYLTLNHLSKDKIIELINKGELLNEVLFLYELARLPFAEPCGNLNIYIGSELVDIFDVVKVNLSKVVYPVENTYIEDFLKKKIAPIHTYQGTSEPIEKGIELIRRVSGSHKLKDAC